MLRVVVGLSTAAAFMAVSTVAVAQQTPQPASQSKAVPNPNEVVCEKQEDTGTRLSQSKICMTRAQWAEQKRMDRKDLDKIQEQRPTR